MKRHVMRLPDLGEGTVSAEVIAWKVAPGDYVKEDAPLVEMSTEKAVVEVPAPVSGRVVSLSGQPGEVIAVGAELVVFEIEDGAGANERTSASANAPPGVSSSATPVRAVTATTTSKITPRRLRRRAGE